MFATAVGSIPASSDMNKSDKFSGIPQVDKLLNDPELAWFFPLISRALSMKIITSVLDKIRKKAAAEEEFYPNEDSCKAAILVELELNNKKRIRNVLNATGIALNTNLGRSPISESAWNNAKAANTSYAAIEYDLLSGQRGSRGGLCSELAALLCGAEAALIVNNNAAGVLLALTALAKDREVIIARGEQVQIGGGFRVPDILELAGAIFVEVGTTNIVSADDYRKAVSAETACALLVHSSNFAIRGFVSKPSAVEIVDAMSGLPVIVDQGSGSTIERIPGELSARSFLAAGCDLVCFSGDKLLGGPQAGIIAGKAVFISRLAAHPLYRAIRPGKTVYSILEQSLIERLNGEASPAFRVLSRPLDELKKFGRKVRAKLPKDCSELIETRAASGGGSSPDEFFDSWGLKLNCASSAKSLQKNLRHGPTPLIAMIRNDALILDLATLANEDPQLIADSIIYAMEKSNSLKYKAEQMTSSSSILLSKNGPLADKNMKEG